MEDAAGKRRAAGQYQRPMTSDKIEQKRRPCQSEPLDHLTHSRRLDFEDREKSGSKDAQQQQDCKFDPDSHADPLNPTRKATLTTTDGPNRELTRRALVHKLLNALSFVRLAGVDVAPGIHRDASDTVELTGQTPAVPKA
jgi:hypothetical protein